MTFLNLGQGNGDYILDNQIALGKIYKWVAPVAGIKQGEYAPVRILASPKQKRFISSGIKLKLSKSSHFHNKQISKSLHFQKNKILSSKNLHFHKTRSYQAKANIVEKILENNLRKTKNANKRKLEIQKASLKNTRKKQNFQD